ncbi:diaminopimelate epimerase [Comamonas endophytica]|uniref:Diaminopimelate epimerase n=1 Tax=Comamonas endophytica TaxID=2949090 RepID=A0ABY6G699_9BURK|nr:MULTISPECIES: diaminopimelate epimerase [unclassified Acidovorax]MCD2511145.1 diaminopimelate epimerase [Acidovorax sp. D4N7]UYG50548.1 diaminopimelate epimerase [Acidovorax sp. 5MLIR]
MQIRFTKMQGAGNDFVVLDETQGQRGLSPAQYRFLADRHFGVGADQILSVRPAPAEGIDFEYAIHNADGGEVEQCGNGARCFARYVHDRGLTTKKVIRVKTLSGVIAPEIVGEGQVRVDMGRPELRPEQVPFDAAGLQSRAVGRAQTWQLPLSDGAAQWIMPVSMGNPHAVLLVDEADTAPVAAVGPQIERHARFPQRVNVGFLQRVSRSEVRLRVYERGTGETLACGTGACAAVVAGIHQGLLDTQVRVHTRGGLLQIAWAGGEGDSVFMTGPATFVFDGQIELPEAP